MLFKKIKIVKGDELFDQTSANFNDETKALDDMRDSASVSPFISDLEELLDNKTSIRPDFLFKRTRLRLAELARARVSRIKIEELKSKNRGSNLESEIKDFPEGLHSDKNYGKERSTSPDFQKEFDEIYQEFFEAFRTINDRIYHTKGFFRFFQRIRFYYALHILTLEYLSLVEKIQSHSKPKT